MVLDPVKLLQYTINKEMKISHLDDCKAVVCKKEDIPENIMSKISKQYDEKFTDDADIIMFVKGPIDKKKVDKIFKCSDRAFGAEANLMTVGDFKLLKMKDGEEDLGEEDFKDNADDSDETPDTEIDKIVNEPSTSDVDAKSDINDDVIEDAIESTDSDETSDEEVSNIINDENEELEDKSKNKENSDEENSSENDDTSDDSNESNNSEDEESEDEDDEDEESEDEESEDEDDEDDSKEDKQVEESINEAGLSPEELMARFAKRKEVEDAKKAEDDAKKLQQKIKSIWVKSLDLNKNIAELQIVYMDGEVKDIDFDITTTGSYSNNGKDIESHENGAKYYAISGEKYQQQDKLYKALEQNLKKSKGKPGCMPKNLDVTDEDVRISMIKTAFNDWRIKWFFGLDKKTEPWFAFSRDGQENDNIIKTSNSFRRMAGQKSQSYKGKPIYQNRNTSIYKVGESEINEDDSEENSSEEKQILPTKFIFIKITMKK